tara:strand:+ start:2218 stop:3447 length:1230 start_codon:yes stop_codon:yes gene_type:complete
LYKSLAKILISIFFLYNLFNLGIANLQIFSIPVLQFSALLISIIFLIKHNRYIENIFSKSFWFFLLIFILYVAAIFINSIAKGYPIIRIIQDAEIFYDILFIFGGIGVAQYIKINDLIKIFTYLFISMGLWFLTIILVGQEFIKFISPTINGVYRSVPLLGGFPSHTLLLLSVPFFLFVKKNNLKNKILSFLIGVITLLAQKRFILIEIFLIVFFYFKRISNKAFINSILIFPLIIFSLFIFQTLEISTSKGSVFNINQMTNLWQSTFVSNEQSGGINWRYNLIVDSIDKVDGIQDVIFGLGFGSSLTNLTDNITGQKIRTPHIFLLIVFLRTGLIGLIFISYFFSTFFITGYKKYITENQYEIKNFNYFILVAFFIFFIEGQTNPTLEYAHSAYVRYFMLGLLLGQKG